MYRTPSGNTALLRYAAAGKWVEALRKHEGHA